MAKNEDRIDSGIGAVPDHEVPEPPAGSADIDVKDIKTNESAHTSNGSHQTNGVKASNQEQQYSIPLNKDYAFTTRKLRVFTIGAGFSGLLMCHKFQHRFPEMQDIVEHTLFEAREDIGGTWLVNDYPGVQCDVPAHIYVSLQH